MLAFAKKHDIKHLQRFCTAEIKGIDSSNSEDSNYRAQKVFVSWAKIDINPYSYLQPSVDLVIKEMESSNDFFESKIVWPHSILEIEGSLEKFSTDLNSFATMKFGDTQSLLGMEKKLDLYIYTFSDNFNSLYRNIRQKAIDLLMKI